MLWPTHHGTKWHPGSRILSNFPKDSLIATVDCNTITHPSTCPIFHTTIEEVTLINNKVDEATDAKHGPFV